MNKFIINLEYSVFFRSGGSRPHHT